MTQRADLGGQDGQVTFNVVFTRGSVSRLLPCALSLRQSPSVRVRLVANGCDRAEADLIRAVAEREGRLVAHVLPYPDAIEHGVALNVLFEAFPEPRFAFADSDVIADGDFMGGLELLPGEAGVFAAPPVWLASGERVSPSRRLLSGRHSHLPDGTYVGNTYCAIYDRATLEPVWGATPLGFSGHQRHQLPRGAKHLLAAQGGAFRWVDSARAINLQLLAAGFALGERDVPQLHHMGGFSGREFSGWRGGMKRALGVLRSSPDGRRLRRVADGVAMRVNRRLDRRPGRWMPQMADRSSAVIGYLDEVLLAVIAGEPPPPAPRTDSPQVDRQVAELVAAIEQHYPPGLAVIREATRAPVARAGAA